MTSSALDDMGFADPSGAPASSAPADRSASPPPLPDEPDVSLIARAALAEGDQDNPASWQNVAGVVVNRMAKSGRSAAAVLAEPGMFEAFKNGRIQGVDPSSPRFRAARAAIQPVIDGAIKVPYDSFYQPKIVKVRGVTPPFPAEQGTMIGSQVFGSGFYRPAAASPSALDDMGFGDSGQSAYQTARGLSGATPQAQAGTAPVRWDPAARMAGRPSPAQASAANFLNQYGFWNADAPEGSSTHPLGMTGNAPEPTSPGTWFLTQDGRLRVAGSDSQDLLPGYRAMVAQRNAAEAAPISTRLANAFGQAGYDVGDTLARLPMARGDPTETALAGIQPGSTEPYTPQMAQGYIGARNQFNLVHGGDPVSALGRAAGQAALVAPMLAGGGAALGAISEAVPALSGALDFLGGQAGGNLLTRGASLATGGALQGAGAAGLTSAASDVPLGKQMVGGAVLGGIAGPVAPALARVGSNLFLGDVSPAVADLAGSAVSKYGIPLRRTQLLAASGDRSAAYADSNMIGRPGTGYAANNASQHEAFTRAVAGTFGEDASALTPEVMSRAKARIGQVFNRVGANTTISDTDGLLTNLGNVAREASQVLPQSDFQPITKQIENIASAIGDDGTLSGESYQALTRRGSPLDRAMASGTPANIRFYAQRIRGGLDDALEAAADPADLADLRQARWQYKNLMTVKDIAAKAGVEGTISPLLLRGAVNRSFKDSAFSGAGDLGELSQIGQTFLKEPPQSGTEPRFWERLKSYGLPVLGGGIDIGIGLHDPALALKLAAGAGAVGAGRFGLSAASGAYNRNPLIRNLMIGGAQGQAPFGGALGRVAQIARPAYVPLSVLGTNQLMATQAP